jgi:hypothetical protein
MAIDSAGWRVSLQHGRSPARIRKSAPPQRACEQTDGLLIRVFLAPMRATGYESKHLRASRTSREESHCARADVSAPTVGSAQWSLANVGSRQCHPVIGHRFPLRLVEASQLQAYRKNRTDRLRKGPLYLKLLRHTVGHNQGASGAGPQVGCQRCELIATPARVRTSIAVLLPDLNDGLGFAAVVEPLNRGWQV